MIKHVAWLLFIVLCAPAFAQDNMEKLPIYFSIGASYAKSKAHAEAHYAGMEEKNTLINDMQPSLKIAIGSYFSNNLRAEVFYQQRSEIGASDYSGSIISKWKAKMYDVGFNSFYTINPSGKTSRLFVGVGLSATSVRPQWEVNGNDLSYLLWDNKFFATPSAFIGIEWPDENNKVAMDITFFYSKTFINRGFSVSGIDYKIKDITSYGAALNFRFNL